MTTERLYYNDSYLTEFRASVVHTSEDGLRVYLDRTAFYPASGGQPHDTGLLDGVPVVEVVEEGDLIAHLTAAPVKAAVAGGRVDWQRRFDHMQQHSGQHLLSATLAEMFGAATVGFHLGQESSTVDVAAASLEPRQILAAEQRANELVFENRPLSVSYEDSGEAQGLRKPSAREGPLRVVSIEGIDRSACGGTHVRATGEIGPVLVRKLDRIRGSVRIEFLCGWRALRRARADYDALSRVARLFSAPLDETPALVAAARDELETGEKARRKLAAEFAQLRGRDEYDATAPDPAGLRRVVRRAASGALDDELRAFAQGFTSRPKAVLVAVVEEPPAVMLAVSDGAGIHAGETLKAALASAGGRGGGSARIAQGSLPDRERLELLLARLA